MYPQKVLGTQKYFFVFCVCFLNFVLFEFTPVNSALLGSCGFFRNTTSTGVSVYNDEQLVIDTDLGTMRLCKEENCSDINNTAVHIELRQQEHLTSFFINGNINILGEVIFHGTRLVSISSCYGNITINSTHVIRVVCTDNEGQRTNCIGTKGCDGCHFYSIGGGGGGAGGKCKANDKCPPSRAHTGINDTILMNAGNPGCHYQSGIAKGGGGFELTALQGSIKIESIIDASGESNNNMCSAGAGGSLRLSANHVDITGKGRLLANGGDNTQSYCSAYYGTHGGGGGIIQIMTTRDCNLTSQSTSVRGGRAHCPGEPGLLLIKKVIRPCQAFTAGAYENKGEYPLSETRYDQAILHRCYYGPKDGTIMSRCTQPWRDKMEEQWSLNDEQCWTKSILISKLAKSGTNAIQIIQALQKIKTLMDQVKQFNVYDIGNISITLEEISRLNSRQSLQVSEGFHKVINNILSLNKTLLMESQQETNSSNRIIEALERFNKVQRFSQQNTTQCFNFEHFAVISTAVNTGQLYSLKNYNICQIEHYNTTDEQRSAKVYEIGLEIQNEGHNSSTVIIIVYKNTDLFTVVGKNERGTLSKYVVTAHVLKENTEQKDAQVTLRYPMKGDSNVGKTHCVSWKFEENNNFGDWSIDRCTFHRNQEAEYDECRCKPSVNLALIKNIGSCQSYTFGTVEERGFFYTKEILHGQILSLNCYYGPLGVAVQAHCVRPWKQSVEEQWDIIDYDKCWFRRDSIAQFAEGGYFNSNIPTVAERIKNLSEKPKTLNFDEIGNISLILEAISKSEKPDSQVAMNFHNTINNLLEANETQLSISHEKFNTTNRILESIERYSETSIPINDNNTEYKIQLKNFAVSITKLKSTEVTAIADSSIFQIYNSYKPICPTWFSASLNIPENIVSQNKSKLMIILYRKTGIFKDRTRQTLANDYVVSASVPGEAIRNLTKAIFVQYPQWQIDKHNTRKPKCVFWDFMADKRHGGWSEDGCTLERNDDGVYGCRCTHLTNFAMLLDLEPGEFDRIKQHMKTLSIISYVGCSVSLLGIALTIFTILFFRELLVSMSCRIILNICLSLGAALAIFLAAAERTNTSSDAYCSTAAILLHYFLLVAISWMMFEGYTMYFAFVKVLPKAQLDEKVPRMWICCIICWGIPAIIVGITAGVAYESYGNDEFCFIQGKAMLVAFFTPIVLLIPFNTATYIFVMRTLLRSGRSLTSTNITCGLEQARRGVAISVFLGLTWVFGVMAVREAKVVFQYVFCLVNSLQGWMIFVFYCVFSTEVRSKYRGCLCSGTSSGQSTAEKGTTSTWVSEAARNEARNTIFDDEADGEHDELC